MFNNDKMRENGVKSGISNMVLYLQLIIRTILTNKTMNHIIQISENIPNSEIHTIIVSRRRYNKLLAYQSLGGFKRYHIDLYDYTSNKNTKLSEIVKITSKYFPENPTVFNRLLK